MYSHKNKQTAIEVHALIALIQNMTIRDRIAPTTAVCQEKYWKFGLKLGEPLTESNKQARFTNK